MLAGAAMGAVGGLATQLRLGADGRPLGRAASGRQHVDRRRRRPAGLRHRRRQRRGPGHRPVSVAHHITGSATWVAALVLMALADVLTRLVVIYLRDRRLAAAPAAPAAVVPAGAHA